ncbi:hypothetical protein [Ileibacterium valens]|uniref:hypothetical protein n=1 Tax=Ileibacterium valens TaxID=1862668 RepID=UPI0024BA5944|nr:hypothetical protein [Ileibacterium valens]
MYILDRLTTVFMNSYPGASSYQISAFLLKNQHKSITLTDVQLDTKISKATLVRFSQAGGFSCFPAMLRALKTEI